jgi:hypothetical protein
MYVSGVSSPGVTPCDLSYVGLCEQCHVCATFEAVARSSEEMRYRIYMFFVTHGAHIDDQ